MIPNIILLAWSIEYMAAKGRTRKEVANCCRQLVEEKIISMDDALELIIEYTTGLPFVEVRG